MTSPHHGAHEAGRRPANDNGQPWVFRPAHVWTPLECTRLAGMWSDGMTTAQIAAALGEGFTRDMVIGKAHRLGLPKRPSPIKRAQREARG